MIDTAGTLCAAANALADRGAAHIYACATHGVFSAQAIDNINKSALNKVVVTDSIYFSEEKRSKTDKIEVLTISKLLAETIKRVHEDKSVAPLFLDVDSGGFLVLE
jgi:ribose-phosphate pyrophosphokinase